MSFVINTYRSLFALTALLLSVSACAQDQTSATTIKVVSNISAAQIESSQWIGTYEPQGQFGKLIINKSTFTWSDCAGVNIRGLTMSEDKLIFEVDPKAKCSWAGWILSLSHTSGSYAKKGDIDLNAAPNIRDFEAKRYMLHSPYVKP